MKNTRMKEERKYPTTDYLFVQAIGIDSIFKQNKRTK